MQGSAQATQPQPQRQQQQYQQQRPFWEQQAAATDEGKDSSREYIDFAAENNAFKKPPPKQQWHRQVQYQPAAQQAVQVAFMREDPDFRQDEQEKYGGHRQVRSAYQAQASTNFNEGYNRNQGYYDGYGNQGTYGGRGRGQPQNLERQQSSQYEPQKQQPGKGRGDGKNKQENEEVQRMEVPKVNEALKEQYRSQYADFDVSQLLSDGGEERKSFSIDQSKQQMHALISQLQDTLSSSKATAAPLVETPFGEKAVQPLQPPLYFNIAGDQRNFEATLGPWRQNRDQIASKMLLRESGQVKADTFDDLFSFNVDELKRKAACDCFKNNPEFQAGVTARVNRELDEIEQKLTRSSNIELSALQLHLKANINVASGQLDNFTFSEPKEPFEMEPEYDGNTKAALISQRLQDEQEIDQLLDATEDPFGEVLEDDETQLDFLIGKFLKDLRDLDVLQQHQEIFKEKQKEKDSAGFKAHQMMEKQHAAADSDDDESKEPTTVIISTTEQTKEQTDASAAEMEEIDELLGESYSKAVSDRQRQGLQSSRLQAEPSHFHLAALEKERRLRPLKKAADHKAGEEDKHENWVVTDNISMANFKHYVQDPAIVYPFELDDFQKRAVYRLEQGNCVMVAAHTSAGKTLVAEYAIALSRRHMTKTIYTSPIKSLSNQKFRDFKLKFGDVGMLTGDVQLNKDASCLIMTTEILQQMLYSDQSRIADVEWVIFDEVHYINDEQRGSVWEEVIIKLPDTVSIVMLSATVPNYLEFAQWVGRVKQKKIYVQYTQERPVPLQHNSIMEGRMVPLKMHNKPVDKQAISDCSKKRHILRNKSEMMKGKNAQQPKNDKKDQNQKKIDFKAKAIKAKENSVKKAIAKTMKSSGGKGASAGGGQQVNGKKKSNFEKTLLAVQKMNLLPCIVFTFSRAGTSQYAEELDPQIDFTDGYTKGLIRKFIKQKIQRLDEADRDLPQILLVTKLLSRGIGIHHAGLLQILKELVEILFSDGYLKVVFATSTFAIGLNLPARSVIFTGLKKFDGSDFGTISTSEYLQMAGRAGRRGKDDCGFSLLCMDPGHQVPANSDLIELLESKGIELESKLNVNYDMCLNSLKQDTEEFGTLLKNSFFANESATVKIQARQNKKRLEPIVARANDLQCEFGVQDQIKNLYNLIDELWNANEQIAGKSVPVPLSIVQLVTEKHLFKDAIVLMNGKTIYSCVVLILWPVGDSMPIAYEEENPNSDFETAMRNNQPSIVNIQGTKGEMLAYECKEISTCMITQTYNERITSLNERQLHFIKRNQLAEKQIRLLAKEYHALFGQLSFEQLATGKKRSKQKVQSLAIRRDEIISQIKSTKCWNCAQVSYHLTQLEVQEKYRAEMSSIDKILQGNVDEKEADFNNRNTILAHYKIVDDSLNILFKGKVAMQACQDKVLLTEFFFSGLINDLTDPELLAVLSIFVTTEKAGGSVAECSKHYSENFTKAFDFVVAQANALIQLEQDNGIVEEQILDKRLNFKFYELVFDWADGKTFKDVVEDTGIDEGSVVKMIMAVNRTRQAIEKMAMVVGDSALAARMNGMEILINRGIVKMQSLYLEVEQEPQKLNERAEDFVLNFDSETGLVKPANQ